jgi:TATA-binding related factor (TRF) of subunit 20 of Mediator complex
VGTSASTLATHSDGAANSIASRPADSLGEYTLISIPSHPDTLFPLMMQRMSPLWVPRQAHRIERGASFETNDWKIRVGELRISGGQGQGRVRGCICEAEFLGEGDGEEGDEGDAEGVITAFFEGLVEGSGVDVGNLKVIGKVCGKGNALVRQYMDLLKFARS